MRGLVDGRYELLDVIASGGMATVWRARDTRLERIVALKRPHPAPPGDPAHRRIEREARAAAALAHPNLVTVYDTGRDDEGAFLVMELVEGPTLKEAGPDLGPDEKVEIAAAVADALAAVHAAGVIHRDVKPANIILSPQGPQLTDFGIALPANDSSSITQTGTVIATPSYAAPEVLEGSDPTAAADVFSLAALTYELVSGDAPFQETDRVTPPPLLDDRRLDGVLRPALSHNPADRPSAADLAESLRGGAPTRPVPVSPGTTEVMATVPREPSKGAGPAPTRVAGAALMGIALVAAAVVAVVAALGDEPGAATDTSAADSTVASTTPTTLVPTSTTPAPTTTVAATTAPPTTAAPTDAAEAHREVVAMVEAIQPSELKPKHSEEIIAKIDDGVEAAQEGDMGKAGEELGKASQLMDDHIEDDDIRAEALNRLDRLAELLGVEVGDPKERDREDDD